MKRWQGNRTHPAEASPVTGHAGAAPPRRRPWLTRSAVPTHQEHLRLAGHSVAVTEDEVGVVELHLE
ncbi:MAG: hypothetical protein QOI76_1155 [Frankiales bacterium]|jgi:hypothetical protein|nr:hypothetical protein [Frankiales bacterium]MDX6257052.1 hypothetical protein [Frankiales bacterium]